MRRPRFLLLVLCSFLLLAVPVAASAQATTEVSVEDIVAEIEQTGRFVDPAASAPAPDVTAAIDRANAAGVAVVLADPTADAEPLSEQIDAEMRATGSTYSSVFVLTPTVIAAQSNESEVDLDRALDAAFAGSGDDGAIDGFVSSLTDSSGGLPAPPTAESNASADDDGTPSSASDFGDGGIGGWFWGILAAVAGFFGIRYFSNKRKRKAAAAANLEVDRDEIAEQLRNNADRVITLGDQVIGSKNAELISLYEEASTTYQAVSLALPEATTAPQIDALDDRIDNAEWQFEVIEARLAGQPDPPSPAEQELAANPPPPSGPALGPDESVFDRSGRPTNRSGTQMPPPQRLPETPRTQRRSSGGGSFGGGMLGSILGQILLGGGGRSSSNSRRTQRRTSSGSTWGGGRSSSGTSIPGPFSRSGRSNSSRRRSGGSRSRRRPGGSRSRSGGSRRR